MPSYTLYYFDVDARAELIRLLLAYAGIEYKEINYSFEDWPNVKGINYIIAYSHPFIQVEKKA